MKNISTRRIILFAIVLLAVAVLGYAVYTSCVTFPHATTQSVYDEAYGDRVVANPDTEPLSAKAISDLVTACSNAYSVMYGGEVTGGFVDVFLDYDAYATFFALVTKDDGSKYPISISFAYEDAQLLYKALDGYYHYEERPLLDIQYEVAMNRLLDVSVSFVGHGLFEEFTLDAPSFSPVDAEDELASKLKSEEVVQLGQPTVDNLNCLLELQHLDAIEVKEAFVTDYSWQNSQHFVDPTYELTPTILWVRSTAGNLYAFEVPDWNYNPHFVSLLEDPASWFGFFFSNAGTLNKVSGPMSPSVFTSAT